MVVPALLTDCAVCIRAAQEEAHAVLTAHVSRTIGVPAAIERAHSAAAVFLVLAAEAAGAVAVRPAIASQTAATTGRVKATSVRPRTVVVTAANGAERAEQHQGENGSADQRKGEASHARVP
jgi:hypothetical protein